MLAIRVALSLVLLLLLAPPASAQFSTEDLNGPWVVHATRVGVMQPREAGWLQGSVLFSRSGAVLDDEVRDQGEALVALRPGALSVNAIGDVVGVLGNASVQGRFVSDRNQIVGVATADAGTLDETNTFFVLVRTPTGAFGQADATGTWRLNSLLVPVPPATTPEYLLGRIVLGDDGTVTGGQLTSSNGSVSSFAGGALFVDPTGTTGTFTGQLSLGPFDDDHTFLSGTFAPGRGLMVGAATRFMPGEERNGMFVLQREPTIGYSPGDAEGAWEFFSVQALSDDTPVGAWLRGTLIADQSGVVNGGTLTDGFGNSFPVTQGFISISGDGLVLAEIVFGLDVLLIQGSMLPSKTQIFGVDDFVGEISPRRGFSTLVKSGPAGPPPAIVQFSAPTYTVTEGTANAVISVVRTGETTIPFTVSFTASPLTAVQGQDFTPVSGTLTFAPGTLSRTFNVPIINNTRVDSINRSVLLRLGAPVGNAVLGSSALAALTIFDNDQSAIQFSASDYVGKEGTPSVITIVRSGALSTPTAVTFTATPGTAAPDLDFTPVSTVVSFTAGLASKTVTVPIRNNALVQGNRTVLLGLSGPTGGAQLGTRATAVLTIPEDDQGGVIKLSAESYTVAETAGSLVVTILRVGTNLVGNVSVPYTTGNGSALSGFDYTARDGVLTFKAGETSKTVSIPILNDTLVEQDETFTFTLGEPTGGASLGSPATATITIKSEDAGGEVKFSAATYRVTEGAGNASITVVRSGGTASGVTVAYATADGTAIAGADYVATSGTLTFKANQTSATIVVPILQDPLAEGNETFTVTLSPPQGGGKLGTLSKATVTIVDDESAIQFSAGDYVGKEGTPSVITIVRSGALSTPATVTFTATPGTAVPGLDFTPVSTVVSFTPGLTSKTVTVPILNNRLVQGDRTVLLGLSGPTGEAQIGTRGAAVLTITEDDQGGLVKLSAGSYTVSEGAGSVAVTIMRTGTNLAGNVSVSYTTGNDSALAGPDYTATVGTVTFNAGDISKTISIPILNDTLVELDKTFIFMLTSATGGATLGSPASATITIKNDDVPSQIRLGASSYKVVEGAGNVSIMVVRSVALFREVTVHYSTSPTGTNPATPGVDYGAVAGDITFAPNQTTAFISIPILQDTEAEGAETFLVTLSDAGSGAVLAQPTSAVVTIVDDESAVHFSQKFIGNMPEVVRSGPANTQITVDFFSEDGTAKQFSDYTPSRGTLTFKVGQSAAYIPLLITPDVLAEGAETFTMFLTNPQPAGSASLGQPSSQMFTITDNDFGGTVQFGTATLTASPGESKAIPIVRTGGGSTILTVNWRAISGTSSEAFSPTSGSVTFGANETTKSFTINADNFDGVRPDVTAVFALSVPPGAANIGATNRSTLTILGSRATVDLPFSVYSVVKGGGPGIISVQRGGTLDRQVSVAYATSNDTALAGRDYTATSGRLTFAAGQDVATFTVPILNSNAAGQTRSLNLTLSAPSPNTFIGEGGNARLQIREAPIFSYRLVADNTDTVLGFGGAPSINDGGAVAYKAFRTDDTVQVIRDTAGAKVTIATAGPEDLLGIDGFRFPIDAAGNVVFLATAGNERQTIFRGSGGGLATLMQTSATYTELFDPSVSPNGTVAFAAAQGDGGPAIFTGPGGVGVNLLVASGDEVFDEVGAYPGVNDDGTVAFVGSTEGVPRGIFLANPNGGGLPAIAPAPGVDTFASLSLNNAGQVAFVTNLPAPDQLGIQVGQNGSAVTTFVSAANGFQLFGTDDDNTPVINSLGDVAYEGLTLENFGILTGPDPARSMVVQVGDPLFGSNVTSLTFGGFNAAGQISFLAGLLDGRQVVVVGTPPATQADLAITDAVSVGSPSAGGTVTFTVTARNNGPGAAAGVQVAQSLPTGYTFVSATPSRGSASLGEGTVQWSVGTLSGSGANNTATLSIVATVLPTGTYNVVASITTAGGVLDPNTANNSTTVTVTPLLQADIAVTKTVDNATPLRGGNVVFTITATNGGPVAATGVQVTDALPSGYTFVSSTSSQGTYTSGTGIWTIGNLAASGAGSSATLQITATVRATGVYNNTAARTASTPTDPNPANNSATVTVTPTTGITLTTQGPLVGVGRTITGSVTLPSPAPTGGVNVTLDTNPTGIVSVAPGTVTIPAGAPTGSFTVTGVAVGGATITASAVGFVAGNVSVTTTSSIISLGALPTIGLGQSTSLPINLSTPAPAGGVTVNFTSSAPTIATVTGSVFIAQGTQVPAANPQVTGVNIGSAQITASAIGFAPDSRTANVAVNVTFTPTTLPVVVGATSNITVNISAAAPAGGLTVNLATGNTSVATVVSPITVPAGQLSAPAAVTGKVVASTTLQASGSGVTSASATINVTPPPAISVVGNAVGKDLEVSSSFSLGAVAPAGGLQVTLTSGDATKLRLSTSATTLGTGQITVTVNAGSASSPIFYYQALDGTGTVTVTATAAGYANGLATVTLQPSGFIVNTPGSINTTTLSNNTNIVITPARLNPTTLAWITNQLLRGGLAPVTVTVTSTDQTGGPNVGAVTPGSVVFKPGDSVQVLAFDPGVTGTAQIAVTPPSGFSTPSNFRTIVATVTTPAITGFGVSVGRDLQLATSFSLGAPAPAGGLPVTVTSGDPARLLLSNTQTAAGAGQITVNVGQGSSGSPAYYLQALDSTGTVTVTLSAAGYSNGSATVTLTPSGFIINSPNVINTTSLSVNQGVQITSARLNAALQWQQNQELRGGITPVTVAVTATDQTGGPGVGTVTPGTVVFNGADVVKSVVFDPAAGGTSLIAVEAPTGFSTPATFRTILATVTAPVITLADQTIGRDMEVFASTGITAPAPTGGQQITLTSSDASKLVLSASGTAAGTGQLVITIPQGSTSSPGFFMQALASAGPVTVTATAPGFTSATATITLTPSGFIINSPTAINTSTFSVNTSMSITPARLNPTTLAWAANQAIRGGLVPVVVAVTATDQTGGPGVGVITPGTVTFNPGDSVKNAAFDPAASGTSLVQVVPPAGFGTPSTFRTLTATVTAPTISISNVQVGRDLQQSVSVSLNALPPSPVTVTLTVASTAIATITTDGAVAGSNTIMFTNVATQSVGNFFVQGRAATGSTTITVQAPGYADAVSTVTTQPSGFIINSPGSFTTTTAGANVGIVITSARLNATTLNWEGNQPLRGGLTASVPVTEVDQTGSGVGSITTSPLSFTGNTSSAITQFDPAAAGTSLITVGIPAGFSTPSNFRSITATVNP